VFLIKKKIHLLFSHFYHQFHFHFESRERTFYKRFLKRYLLFGGKYSFVGSQLTTGGGGAQTSQTWHFGHGGGLKK
jgi:hypothetical protein